MHTVLDHIDAAQARFARHPLFARMATAPTMDTLRPLVEGLAPWVLAFHDVLQLVEDRMVAPEYRRLARHHHAEEGGHDRWYLADLPRLGVALPTGPALFGRSHAGVRYAAYALVAEALDAETDPERLAILLAMEATGAEFFKASASLAPLGPPGLQFFSGHHLEVEQSHQLFEQRMRAWVRAQTLTPTQREATIARVDRVFSRFEDMFDALDARFGGTGVRAAG